MKPTIRQEAAFKIMLEKLKKKEPAVLKTIMREAGFAPSTCINPELNLTSRPGWQILKGQLDSNGARDALNELVSAENEDKRTRFSAAVEIIKIQDGYPKQDNKVIGLFEKIGELQINDKPGNTSE